MILFINKQKTFTSFKETKAFCLLMNKIQVGGDYNEKNGIK